MKISKIYQITIKSDNQEIDSESHPIYEELSTIIGEEGGKYMGFEDDKIFVRLVDYKFNNLCNLLSKYNIIFEFIDVSEGVIKGDIQKEYTQVENLTPNLFKDFRYDNTSINDILDKINERGIGSIDSIDKDILKIKGLV